MAALTHIRKKTLLRVALGIGGFLALYVLMMIPTLFLYPHYNDPIKRNIPREYFHELAEDLSGDCYRISNNFEKECPFPTREVHLNSEHTIVEININDKWYAYDPLYQRFFEGQNAMQICYDLNRGYMPTYLKDYEYKTSFQTIHYYHNWYYIFLKKINPNYSKVVCVLYDLAN